jgi:hypothetical protein
VYPLKLVGASKGDSMVLNEKADDLRMSLLESGGGTLFGRVIREGGLYEQLRF